MVHHYLACWDSPLGAFGLGTLGFARIVGLRPPYKGNPLQGKFQYNGKFPKGNPSTRTKSQYNGKFPLQREIPLLYYGNPLTMEIPLQWKSPYNGNPRSNPAMAATLSVMNPWGLWRKRKTLTKATDLVLLRLKSWIREN